MSDYKWNMPPDVAAPGPTDRASTIWLRISTDLTRARSSNVRLTPLFMVWTHVLGEFPPINAIEQLAEATPQPTICSLFDATACFQGVHRPHRKEDNGDSVVVYVLKPAVTIEFAAGMACVARAVVPRRPFVLTVQVVLADSLQERVTGVDGLLTRIEPVACDPHDETLPVDHQDRYLRRWW